MTNRIHWPRTLTLLATAAFWVGVFLFLAFLGACAGPNYQPSNTSSSCRWVTPIGTRIPKCLPITQTPAPVNGGEIITIQPEDALAQGKPSTRGPR